MLIEWRLAHRRLLCAVQSEGCLSFAAPRVEAHEVVTTFLRYETDDAEENDDGLRNVSLIKKHPMEDYDKKSSPQKCGWVVVEQK